MNGVEADGTTLEIEVKVRAPSVDEALRRLAHLPALARDTRRFEDNDIYDTPDRALSGRHHLLRLRVVEGRGTVTFKQRVESDLRAKVRAEAQTGVTSPEATREILRSLGYVRIYRYQKYRRYYAWTDPATGAALAITLDETPIGVFMELEGPKEGIDRAAGRMGYAESDYIVDDYRALHLEWLKDRSLPETDMVFSGPDPGGPSR
ncbi:MAG TPA: class IV adenylate cyclase [Candidatus Polarisedimenticolia bacterium]|jgi:adenylate cyclase class 2